MTQPIPDYHAGERDKSRKQAVNLSINKALLKKARELQINLSRLLEAALAEQIRQEERRNWIEENRDALEEYNARIEEEGAFSDKLRSF